ncbi:MAG: decaprenyl-phosphate phosphoribosyltransferase [Candidatus Eisenbacteria sp.]|nr:decaprenyl-phosphate phosphoribosyltransferase [Candidatus Eisenbacteria bacterium]
MIGALVRELRPWQWPKNFFVLAGVVFAHQVNDPEQVVRAVAAMAAFCLLSSAGYVFNDLQDIERDRIHPRKRRRPLAAGAIPIPLGWGLVAFLTVGGLGLSLLLGPAMGVLAASYLLLNLLYSLVLKQLVLLDVMAIAVGFVLRAVAGVETLAPRPELSPWLLVCTFFLALFIAVGKRRHERVTLATEAELHRSTLAEYPPELLDQLVSVVTGATILAYAIYTISPATSQHVAGGRLVLTIPFVVYGVFRYLYLVYRRGRGGEPSELLFRDGPLLANVVLWGAAILGILYLG